jgi:hypothetical protein
MADNTTTPAEKAERRAQIEVLLEQQFGPGHGSNVDMGAILRVNGNTNVRFQHEGKFWDLSLAGGTLTLAEAK